MLLAHDSQHTVNDVGVLCRHVGGFTDVLGKVEELDLRVSLVHVLADRLPVAEADRLLTAVPAKFPIEKLVLFLLPLAKQCRQETHAVDVAGRLRSRDFAQGRHHVLERGDVIRCPARWNVFRPAHDHRYPYAALDRKSTRLNSSHVALSRMPSSA